MSEFNWEYFLRQYIDISVRWNIGEGTLLALDSYFKSGRSEWEKFVKEFRINKANLNQPQKENLFEDLRGDFYPMIEGYLLWYNNNKDEINVTVKSSINPYSALVEFCKDTKREIEKLEIKHEEDNPKNAYRKITKEEYFRISERGNYPKRCPILAICQRRAFTLYLMQITENKKSKISFEEYQANLIRNKELKEEIVEIVGESPSCIGGNNNWIMSRICPEVSLFDTINVVFGDQGLAVTQVSYDKYYDTPSKIKIHECGHFSECSEYNEHKTRIGASREDIVEVKPNFYGIGLNLNAAWRRLFGKRR